MKTFNQISQSAGYREDDISVSITVCGGSYGGGSEVLVVEGFIADHPTPKVQSGGGAMYTLNSRDYKGVMIVVLSEDNRPTDGEQPSGQLLRTGRIQ